jgi:exodeoxyribonuclease V alpha subunit
MLINAKNQEQEIKGVVKRILSSYPNGNSIVAFESSDIPQAYRNRDYPDNFVAIGSFARVVENQTLLVRGKWTLHNQYGWRLMVSSYEEVIPTSRDAIVDYLASGLFKGIGKKMAESIVDVFGEDTMRVIEEEPHRLEEVKGIAGKRIAGIVASYFETKHIQDLMLAFKPYNIGNSRIVKIYKMYGKDALKKVKENPYRLCEDIDGIGFKTADTFAKVCGIEHDSPFRIRAGIIHVLNEKANSEGHVYLRRDELHKELGKLLVRDDKKVPPEAIDDVIEDMDLKSELVLEGDDIYLAVLYYCERNAGEKIGKMLQVPPRKFTENTDRIIAELESSSGVKYADNQKIAFKMLERSNVLIITGGPGTGKTTIIKDLISIFRRNFPDGTIALAAPTGRAAKRMEEATGHEASTIHRLLEIKSLDDRMYCQRDENNPIEADMIILDECSMIDLRLFHIFLKAVRPETRLVLVGDADQLPSVGAGDVFRDLIKSGKVPTVQLNEIFRQEGTSRVVVNANRVNNGWLNLEYGDDFIYASEDNPDMIPERIKLFYQAELKRGLTPDEIQVLSPFRKRTATGSDSLNAQLQELVNPKADGKAEIMYGSKTFREGDKVMQQRNDYSKLVFNGDIGRITKINEKTEEGQTLDIEMSDGPVLYEREELSDIDLAYASTVHKSQGCEYRTVIIPITMQHYKLLQRNLVYTAITRAREKVILVGQPKALVIAVKNNEVSKRNSKLYERVY